MLEFIKKIFKPDSGNINEQSSSVKSWYLERYDSIIVQRNGLLMLSLVSLIIVSISVFSISKIVNSKSFHPVVIQIEENTGRAVVVNPSTSEILGGNEALARYFIQKYLIARETYNPVDFDTLAKKTVRLFSKGEIYGQYINSITSKDNDPKKKYGTSTSTSLRIKSWNTIDKDGKKMIVRFSIYESSGNQKVLNKIAVVEYDYVAMELSDMDTDINPVGFQIQAYRVDDDNS